MGKAKRVRETRRDRDELELLLHQQFKFLRSSVQLVDRGEFHEVVRLATTVRTLVHDTPHSISLLQQLELKDRLPWRDSSLLPQQAIDKSIAPVCNLVAMSHVGYVPAFTIRPTRQAPERNFASWWQYSIARDPGQFDQFSRKDLVLALANKQGGAHVDPGGPSDAYRKLDGSNFMGVEIVEGGHPSDPDFADRPGRPLEGSVAVAAMRQVADEVGVTLEPWILGNAISSE